MKVIKRDGRVVPFDAGKIVHAVEAAMKETEAGVDQALSARIAEQISRKNVDCTVESIQDAVEKALMSSSRKDVAKKYIIYRNRRTRERDMNNEIMRKVRGKTSGHQIDNANANVDERTFGGRKNEAASVIQKTIALESVMSPDVAEAHKSGLIYQHDLDHFNVGAHNCLFIDFEHIFTNGFATRNCDVRPPSSFSTACQLVAVSLQLQSQCQYGKHSCRTKTM